MAQLQTVFAVQGPLFHISFADAMALVTHGTNAALAQAINPTLEHVGTQAPEGTLIEMIWPNWPTVPLIGHVGQLTANHVNQAWNAGKLRYASGPRAGQRMELWATVDGGTGQLATYDARTDTVTFRWVKRGLGLVYLLLIVLGFFVALGVVNYFLGKSGHEVKFHGFVPVVTKKPTAPAPGTPASWWANLSFLDKALLLGGGLGLVGFGVYVYGEERIHKAGATHENINVYTGP